MEFSWITLFRRLGRRHLNFEVRNWGTTLRLVLDLEHGIGALSWCSLFLGSLRHDNRLNRLLCLSNWLDLWNTVLEFAILNNCRRFLYMNTFGFRVWHVNCHFVLLSSTHGDMSEVWMEMSAASTGISLLLGSITWIRHWGLALFFHWRRLYIKDGLWLRLLWCRLINNFGWSPAKCAWRWLLRCPTGWCS